MKAFQFRLDPALRWRTTQLRLEREATSKVSALITSLQKDINTTHSELRSGSAELVNAGSAAFGSWAAYVDRCRRKIRTLEEQLSLARRNLLAQTAKMVEAHQKLTVLENLKRDEHLIWESELNRETQVFADEAYLAKSVREVRSAISRAENPDPR